MKYNEAKQEKERRDAEWEAYYAECGCPENEAYYECVINAPENIFNYNFITRYSKSLMVVVEENNGIYERPIDWMVIGEASAEVSDYALNESNDWECISRRYTRKW